MHEQFSLFTPGIFETSCCVCSISPRRLFTTNASDILHLIIHLTKHLGCKLEVKCRPKCLSKWIINVVKTNTNCDNTLQQKQMPTVSRWRHIIRFQQALFLFDTGPSVCSIIWIVPVLLSRHVGEHGRPLAVRSLLLLKCRGAVRPIGLLQHQLHLALREFGWDWQTPSIVYGGEFGAVRSSGCRAWRTPCTRLWTVVSKDFVR